LGKRLNNTFFYVSCCWPRVITPGEWSGRLNGENVVISDADAGEPRPKVNDDTDIIDEFDATNAVVYPINAVLLPPTDSGTRRYLRA
jgi:uncharacterized surface protein with fasciclin (FAS1) repeats